MAGALAGTAQKAEGTEFDWRAAKLVRRKGNVNLLHDTHNAMKRSCMINHATGFGIRSKGCLCCSGQEVEQENMAAILPQDLFIAIIMQTSENDKYC